MNHVRNRLHQLFRNYYFDSGGSGRRPIQLALKPLVPIYRLLLDLDQRRRLSNRRSLPVPVVSVGNLSIGGTGKTAVVKYILKLLVEAGFEPGVLKRGQAQNDGVVHGNMDEVELDKYGDEVALLARSFPELRLGVGGDRFRKAKQLIEQSSPDLIVMDDGFQHLQLERDLDLVLLGRADEVEAATLPAGPLREPPEALERADLISIKGQTSRELSDYTSAPVLNHCYQLEEIVRNGKQVGERIKNKQLQLLTTLARPTDLVDFLTEAGYGFEKKIFLPDHAELDPEFVRSSFSPSRLVVTEKEYYKLPGELRSQVNLVRSRIRFDPAEKLRQKLGQLLGAKL